MADRPAAGEELAAPGAVTVPRTAATVVLLRGGASRLEILLARRTPKARFMGGAWVFPGGAVDPGDGEGDRGLRACAVREVAEEVAIALTDPGALVPFARWITPAEVKIRYDTWFYLAATPAGAEARADGQEMVDARWFAPERALAGYAAGDLELVFPTIKTLETLARHDSAEALLAWAAEREVVPVRPRVEGHGEAARIVLD